MHVGECISVYTLASLVHFCVQTRFARVCRMFSDPFSKRVNLSGRSVGSKDLKTFIDSQRIEREQRERLRIQANACVDIQRVWRGYRQRFRCAQEFSAMLDTCANPLTLFMFAGPQSEETLRRIVHCFLAEDWNMWERTVLIVRMRSLVSRCLHVCDDCVCVLLEKLPPTSLPSILLGQRNLSHVLKICSPSVVTNLNYTEIFWKCWEVRSDLGVLPVEGVRMDTGSVDRDWDVILRNMVEAIIAGSRIEYTQLVSGFVAKMASTEGRKSVANLLIAQCRTPSHNTSWIDLVFSVVDEFPTDLEFSVEMLTRLVKRMNDARAPFNEERLFKGFTDLLEPLVMAPNLWPVGIESVVYKVNRFAYNLIIRGDFADWVSLFKLLGNVHSVSPVSWTWEIPESATFISANVNTLEIIDRADPEDDLDEDLGELGAPAGRGTVLDNLINYIPHVVPFRDRVKVFTSALLIDKRDNVSEWRRGRTVRIRRNRLLEDGLEHVFGSSEDLKSIVRVEFMDESGLVEAGIDGGGLFKEFLHLWIRKVFESEHLFVQLASGRMSPVGGSSRIYTALGRAIGKAIYEMVLLETHLGESFLARVLGKPHSIESLLEIDESLYKNLQFVRDCENVDELMLTFAVCDDRGEQIDLMANGCEICVTNSNRIEYIHLVSWYHLTRRLDQPSVQFAAGLNEVIPLTWLRMFTPREINVLVSGENARGFDTADLRANTVYGGGYFDYSPNIELFWDVVKNLSPQDQSAFLTFVTSCPRPPLLGFRVLYPKFGINRVPERDRLPTASTCANLFKLPDYQNRTILTEKLLAAIHSQSGFDLS